MSALVTSLTIGLISNVLFLAAFQFRIDWFLDPEKMITAGPLSAELLRWASVLDLIGYYLATGVLAYALWRLLRPRDSVVMDLATLAAMAYTVAGGAAAAVLAMIGPMLMQQHTSAAAADQATTALQFGLLFEGVWRAVWQLFDGILLGAWWLGIGLVLRQDHRVVARLSIALSAAAAVGVVFNVAGLDLARDVILGVVFFLWTAWWLLLLAAFRGNRPPFVTP